jgi:hypothetical protein
MSKSITGVTDIRNMTILKQSLTELGISFNELNAEKMTWGTGYQKMTVDISTGEIRFDEMYAKNVNQIKQAYSKHFILAEIAKKGHRINSVNTVNGNIEIVAGY